MNETGLWFVYYNALCGLIMKTLTFCSQVSQMGSVECDLIVLPFGSFSHDAFTKPHEFLDPLSLAFKRNVPSCVLCVNT